MRLNAGEAGEGQWGCIVLFALAVLIAAGGWFVADRAGYIAHDHSTPVWIQGNWIVGEYRECQMRTKTVPEHDKHLDSLDKLPRLLCGEDADGLFDFERESSGLPTLDTPPPQLLSVTADSLNGYFHVISVHYFGRIDRTDKLVVFWHCLRKSKSLECKAWN